MSTTGNFQSLLAHRPLYGQVRDLIHARIKNGAWTEGQSIPNESRLASEFGVSIGTVRRAMEGLERAGVIARKQGRGSFVRGKVETSECGSFRGRLPNGAETEELLYTVFNAVRRNAIAKERALLEDDREVVELCVHLKFRSQTVGHEVALVSAVVVDAAREDCRSLVGEETGGVARLLQHFGVRLQRVEDRLSVLASTQAISEAIQMQTDEPILHCRRRFLAHGERTVAVVTGHYRASQVVYVSDNAVAFD